MRFTELKTFFDEANILCVRRSSLIGIFILSLMSYNVFMQCYNVLFKKRIAFIPNSIMLISYEDFKATIKGTKATYQTSNPAKAIDALQIL